MTPERYRRINELADEVLELPPEGRHAYLDHACGGDAELRVEVERLVAAHAESAEFLAVPAVARLADAFIEPVMRPNWAGRLIERYRFERLLGSGGHGEVWLAEDTQLGRQVAIKLLARGYAASVEARMSSALNHPNIVTIYDTGELDGTGFIAQEYVAGETLRQRLSRGPIELRAALPIFVQIASALEAAHAAGIVHRDIKPENIMIREDGIAKVLDFGLARTTIESGAPRVLMGTARYIAPEQVRGAATDARTDLFSFGVVLYESLCGQAPFAGATTAEVLGRIADAKPAPLSAQVRGHPRKVERVVARALAKDPEARYRSAAELNRDLLTLGQRRVRIQWPWIAVAAAILAGLLIYRATVGEDSGLEDMKVSLVTPPGVASDAAISPDGSVIGFVLEGAAGQSISLERIGTPGGREVLAATPGNRRDLTCAPDGRWLYYIDGPSDWTGALYRIPVGGGNPVRLLDNVTGRFALSRDARHVAFIRLDTGHWAESLIVADSDGRNERVIKTRHRPQYFSRRGLAWSPDGRSIISLAGNAPSYTAHAFRVIEVDVSTGAERAITGGRWAWSGSVTWSADGRSVLVDAAEHSDDALQLWRVSYPRGNIQRVTNDVSDHRRITQSADSRTVLAVRRAQEADLWVLRIGATEPVQLSSGELRSLNSAAIAPGGRLFYSASAGDARNIWTVEATGSSRRQVTTADSDQNELAVSRDGRFLAYQSDGRIWRMNTDGSGAVQLTHGPLDVHPAFSADGRWIVYASFSGWSPGIGGHPSLWRVPVGGGRPDQLTHDVNSLPDVSPDGKWIAAACLRYDHPQLPPQIGIYPFDGGRAVTVLERRAGADAAVFWSANGDAVEYVVSAKGVGNIWRQPVSGGAPTPITHFHSEQLFFFNPSTDRKSVVLARGKDMTDLVLIRGIH